MPTKTCKICFKNLISDNPYYLCNISACLCNNCLNSLNAVFDKFSVLGIEAIFIYQYDEKLKSLIYQFKACGDIELSSVFLERFAKELHQKYNDFYLCPAPSFALDDEERGFNHVVEIFKYLKLPFLNVFEKVDKHKQSSQTAKERKNIDKHIRLKHNKGIFNKNILIVDDIFTTGSTIRFMIQEIKKHKPKSIKILVLCKTINLDMFD